MFIPILVLLAALAMMWVEARQPGRKWPRVRGWWARAILFNSLQAATVWGIGLGWARYIGHIPEQSELGIIGGAVVGYLVQTFIYYWWHRARHENGFLWRWLHQLHHSPQRLEVVTSFYKHPFEIGANALLSAAVMYLVLGLTPDQAAGAALLGGLAELFYHWNVATPRWVGYLIQRPESHCVHHEEGKHACNYGDLPLWDMLFGTFQNPETFDSRCGFGDGEHRVTEMLAGVDVHDDNAASSMRWRGFALGVLGLAAMFGHVIGQPLVKGAALATAASPAPKVFTTRNGLESFSSTFALQWEDTAGDVQTLPLTYDVYPRLRGPYNRRNVYGAVLAFGPVLSSDESTGPAFDEISTYALCPGGPIWDELGIDGAVRNPRIVYEHRDGTPEQWPRRIDIACEEGA